MAVPKDVEQKVANEVIGQPIGDAELAEMQRRYFIHSKARDPMRVLESFLAYFGFRASRARLAKVPPDYVLEWLADRFRVYVRGKGSLDQAFGLVSKGKRGLASPKEIHTRRKRAWWADYWFSQYLAEEKKKHSRNSRQYALRRTADQLVKQFRAPCDTRKVVRLLRQN